MFTLQGLMMKSEAIMEQIRIEAIEYTFEQFKVATRHYYETSEGGDIAVKLIHKLEGSEPTWKSYSTPISISGMKSKQHRRRQDNEALHERGMGKD